MWEVLDEPWRVCLEELWAGYCAGSVPHGAVVIGPDGRVLARAHNRQVVRTGGSERDRVSTPAPGPGGIADLLAGHRLAHAELIALLSFDPAAAGVDAAACALYTANEPCPLCAGATAMSGIRALHYAARDGYGGAAALLEAMPILRGRPVAVQGAADPLLEGAVIVMRVEYRLHRGPERARTIRTAAKAIRPDAVAVADRLFAEAVLPRLRDDRVPAREAFDLVASRF